MQETKKYRHLSRGDREVIYRMNQQGMKQVEIASVIGKHQSTISRELSRNGGGTAGYRVDLARRKAHDRQRLKKRRGRVITGKIKAHIIQRLHRNQTPELISGAMRRAGMFNPPSHETIYQFIIRDKLDGGDLWQTLPINRRRKYKRRSKASRRGGLRIPNRVGLEHRPEIVARRERYGDWEVDLISGHNRSGYILSVFERKSRLGKLFKLENRGSTETAEAIIELLQGYQVHTMTFDNGLEFAKHHRVTEALGAKGYFCAPYHSWEKGGVENYNRLVRFYYPKGSNFSEITQSDLQKIETELNERPRKILKFGSPIELEPKLAA